jgi:uncharacterized protein (DUF4415 family)
VRKTIQRFTAAHIKEGRHLDPAQIVDFLESFRELQGMVHRPKERRAPSQLISIKMPPELLGAFRARCEIEGVPYQTRIKELMADWLRTAPAGSRAPRARGRRA